MGEGGCRDGETWRLITNPIILGDEEIGFEETRGQWRQCQLLAGIVERSLRGDRRLWLTI